jgi:hypothetical protein
MTLLGRKRRWRRGEGVGWGMLPSSWSPAVKAVGGREEEDPSHSSLCCGRVQRKPECTRLECVALEETLRQEGVGRVGRLAWWVGSQA